MEAPNIDQYSPEIGTFRPDPNKDVGMVYNDIVAKSQFKQLNTTQLADLSIMENNSLESLRMTPNKIGFQNKGFQIKDAYTQLSDGDFITRYDDFLQGSDNEQRYAEQQSTGSKWLNGLGKFGLKTVVNTVGGTLGTAYGAMSAIAEGNWENIYDNSFYDFLDDQNTKMDNFAANYRTQEERNNGFGSSMLTANFWADDFLGGMSFMVGTVMSEALWATATGGASLTTTAARVGLRGSKYFAAAKALTKGVDEAQSTMRKYNRLSAMQSATSRATTFGKIGEAANLARFTYTGAGFEAGMEARLYQKEQRDNFYKDFEQMNGRKPTSTEISDFEDNLGSTTNALWATNMALVGTSNFAILGKTFGITSPFKASTKSLDKALFGKGVTSTFDKGVRTGTEAIKRTKLQKTLGFSKGLLKNPFYEGFVEEGGQAASSSAMENYLTSRYNPNKEYMDVTESIYEGFSHTYGSKEGWKEIGLGMLIGFFGGEGSNIASQGTKGFLAEARGALNTQDANAVKEAENMNNNLGTEMVRRIYATKINENLVKATDVQNAQEEYNKAEDKGSVMGMANAQGRLMLTSVKSAVDFDYLEDQVKDFETALKMQDPNELAKHYDIDVSEVDGKIEEIVGEYKKVGDSYTKAKDFADYMISDNPKELYEDATDIDVQAARGAIAYQMVMTEIMETNMDGAHQALKDSVNELNPQLASRYMQALNRYNQINKSKKQDVEALAKVENSLTLKRDQLDKLNRELVRLDQTKVTAEGNQNDANKYNSITNKIAKLQQEIAVLQQDKLQKESKLTQLKGEMSTVNSATRQLASQLDMIDPLAGTELVSEMTIEETRKTLEELDGTLNEVSSTNPQLVERITRLGKEYRDGLTMWKRNADTIADLTDPNLGLKRVGTMMQKKKTAGETTLNFLERLNQTEAEEREFTRALNSALENPPTAPTQTDTTTQEESEQDKADNSTPDDILATETLRNLTEQEVNEIEKLFDVSIERNIGDGNYNVTGENSQRVKAAQGAIYAKQVTKSASTLLQDKINELNRRLDELVGKNKFLLDNFTDSAERLSTEKAPTQEDLDEYRQIRNNLKSGDINSLLRPIEQIGKRIKERSGLTDEQILRYQELSQKMKDWRIVLGTNANGVSVEDILNQIEAYKMQLSESNTQVTAEQQLEYSDQSLTEFSNNVVYPDMVNTMSVVNVRASSTETEISHMSLDTVANNGFEISPMIRKENKGTEEKPKIVSVYEVTKEGETYEIEVADSNNRIYVPFLNADKFLDGMGIRKVKYNTSTGWGYIFKDGVYMPSDFGIKGVNDPTKEIMNPQSVYNLKPGDKVRFEVNMQDSYINSVIIPLIKEGKTEEAKAKMSIYMINSDGQVFGFLQADHGESNDDTTNFNTVRDEAFNTLMENLNERNEPTLEDLAEDSESASKILPYEVEVEKVFIGAPNIEINEDGSPKVFTIDPSKVKTTENPNGIIIDKGFSTQGKLEQDDKDIRMAFIPKEKNTPYVIILHGENKVAFPVSMIPTASNLQEQVMEILNSDIREQQQITDIIRLLKENGIEPAQFNLDSLKDNSSELNRLLSSLDSATRTYTKEELKAMTLPEFAMAAEIVINLEKEAFVSPKVKIGLSKKLIDTRTGEESSDKPMTADEMDELIARYSERLSLMTTKEEVGKFVASTNDARFQKQFLENTAFNKKVNDFAKASKGVPRIMTQQMAENILMEIVDTDYSDIPLELRESFEQDINDLATNMYTPVEMRKKVSALATKMMKQMKNRYEVVSADMDINGLYHIGTSENEQQMFEQGYVKIVGDFYRKVKNDYTMEELLTGLYEKHKNGTLPFNMQGEYKSIEDFTEQMPKTALDIYKRYYNSQESEPLSKSATVTGNTQYLRNDFETDFLQFKKEHEKDGTDLYKNLLSMFDYSPSKGITKNPLLKRETIDKYQQDLGSLYPALIEYSLINKHIDLQETAEKPIFVADVDQMRRLEAVNDPNLKEVKEVIHNFNDDGSITLGKKNPDFVIWKDGIYEKGQDAGNGLYDYDFIAEVDNKFFITEVTPPFVIKDNIEETEIDGTKPSVNTTTGTAIKPCD